MIKSSIAAISALVTLSSCGFLRDTPNNGPRMEAYTYTFCREQTENDRELVLNRLLEIGWIYAGPLNNDGLNCTTVLFTREARER
jgi:hypothetical protein